MKIFAFAFVVTFGLLGAAPASEPPEAFIGRSIHEDAPDEVKFWGALLGDWQVRWESYDESGTPKNNGEATWHWYSTLGGFALQDFYTHPMKDPTRPDRVGTNLRVFDTKKGEWQIRWSHNYGNGYEAFSGVQDGDQIVVYALGEEAHSRVRFFNFTENAFRQQEEKSDDGGVTWRASFKAWATRIEQE